jgi:hypothetical protein
MDVMERVERQLTGAIQRRDDIGHFQLTTVVEMDAGA